MKNKTNYFNDKTKIIFIFEKSMFSFYMYTVVLLFETNFIRFSNRSPVNNYQIVRIFCDVVKNDLDYANPQK